MTEDFNLTDIVEQVQKRYMDAREEVVAKTIVDISRGVYKSYTEYIKRMEELKELYEKARNVEFSTTKYELSMNFLVEPFIVTERLFNLIKNY